jgi:hypothetical protein
MRYKVIQLGPRLWAVLDTWDGYALDHYERKETAEAHAAEWNEPYK